MGALEDLASALAGEQVQQQIAAENPYYNFASAPRAYNQAIGQAVSQTPYGTFSKKEIYGNALLSGLLSGALSSFGDDYQGKLTDRYQNTAAALAAGDASNAAGLSPNLFRKAKDAVGIFNLQRRVSDEEFAKQSILKSKEAFSKALVEAKTPRQQQQILEAGARLGFIEPTKEQAPTSEMQATAKESGGSRGVEGTLLDELSAEANKLMDSGAEPPQAFTTAREFMKTKRDELDRQYKRVEEAEKSAQDLKTVTGQLRSALAGAGDTGLAGGARNVGAQVLGLFSEGQRKKAAAGQDVQTFAGEAIKNMGPAFKGPMSDRDVQIMLRTAPSLNTDEETNSKILDRWSFAAELQQTYAEFMREAQAKGVAVSQAESAWNQLREKNPYVIKEGNDWIINPAWLGGSNPMTEENTGGASGSWGEGEASGVPAGAVLVPGKLTKSGGPVYSVNGKYWTP